MSKPVILTGLRANNDLHLGSYLGAILPMVELQKKYGQEYQINMFIPDLHSFTTPIDHGKLYEQSMHNLRLFIASGLDMDHENTYLYRQSRVSAHSELTVILNCFTYMGELRRMTQFKEKTSSVGKAELDKVISETRYKERLRTAIQVNRDNSAVLDTKLDELQSELLGRFYKHAFEHSSVGLFDYPVLMAADILLYGARYVPVGADQTQHVELARDIAIRMNNKFGELFTLPEAEKDQIAFTKQQHRLRIKDLLEPTKKMSKSDETGKGVLFLGDDPAVAAKKVMSATTDSLGKIAYDHENQPGISNLMDIYAALSGKDLADVRAEFEGQTQYGPFKTAVAGAVSDFLTDFQRRLGAVDDDALQAKLDSSESAMNEVASATLRRVQHAVGLRKD